MQRIKNNILRRTWLVVVFPMVLAVVFVKAAGKWAKECWRMRWVLTQEFKGVVSKGFRRA